MQNNLLNREHKMGKLFLFMNVSLDGYVEDANHDTSAFQTRDSKFEAFQQKQGKGAGTILLGRRTYDIMQQFWPTPMAAQMIPEVAAYMNATPKLVVSHSAFAPEWENTTVISSDVVGQLRRYKAESTEEIIILGSNNLSVTLIQAGLIDEFQIVLI
jgi:dihydrofolate reductase